MLKIKESCGVCKTIKEEPALLEKIFKSQAYLKSSSVSLNNIHQAYEGKFSYRSLLNHCKNHQFMSDEDYNSRHLRQIAKKAEKDILKRKIESGEVWDKVIAQGIEGLEEGTMAVKTADLLKAAKDKSDYELKTKDQELAFAEMMYFFASGENQNNLRKPYDRKYVEGETVENIHPAQGIAADSRAGEDGPSAVYYPPSWDAAT